MRNAIFMKNTRIAKPLLAVLLAVLLTAGLFPVAARADDGNGYTVFVSFEGYTLGYGFFVEPTAVTVPAGATVMDAALALLYELGLDYELTEWGGIDRIHGIHPSAPPNPPEFITIELEAGPSDGSLGAFDYSEYAGWMFTVNHTMPPVGADALEVSNGDVIRWQFSVEGWGGDLGLGEDRGFWTQPPYEHADKTYLVRALFVGDISDEDKAAALEVIIDPLATEEAVEVMLGVLAVDDPYAYGEYDETDDADDYATDEDTTADALAWTNPFTDVTCCDWFYSYVGYVFENGIMTGAAPDRFAPEASLSRAMAFTIIWRLEGSPDAGAARVFGDVAAGRWYFDAVGWAYENGLLGAYLSDDLFAPAQSITAEQLAAALDAYAVLVGFDDADAVAQIFDAVAPGTVTRAQAAAILVQFIQLVQVL